MKNYIVNEDGTITSKGYIEDKFNYARWNDTMNALYEEDTEDDE